jgi:hypothetical protein
MLVLPGEVWDVRIWWCGGFFCSFHSQHIAKRYIHIRQIPPLTSQIARTPSIPVNSDCSAYLSPF